MIRSSILGPLAAALLVVAGASADSGSRGDSLLEIAADLTRAEKAVAAGDLPEARALYTDCVARCRALGGPTMHLARSLDGLADVLRVSGEFEEAERYYLRSLPLWDELLGPGQPRQAVSEHNLASVYLRLGRPGAAEPLLRGALATFERALGPESPEAVETRRLHEKVMVRLEGRETPVRAPRE